MTNPGITKTLHIVLTVVLFIMIAMAVDVNGFFTRLLVR
jgi:hypothetical protein